MFGKDDIEWKTIYLIPRTVTTNTFMRCFQYKILNNVLFLNKHLAAWGLADSTLCSFCNIENETTTHIFAGCEVTQSLWSDFKVFLENKIELPPLDSQSGIFGFTKIEQ